MVLALDPRYPRVWRTPDTLQFGVDAPRLVLDGVGLAEERMIAALADGVSASGLRMIAKRSRSDAGAVESLLDRLAPVLLRAPARASGSESAREGEAAVVLLDGEGATAARVLGLLRDAGVDARGGVAWGDPAVEGAACAVIIGSFAIEPERHARWLRRDVRHLPIVFGDSGVVVGPLVVPGRGPCVRCVDLHRADAEPAWPAMAAQLFARPRFGESAAVADAVAGVATTVVVEAVGGGALTRGRRPVSQHFDPSTGRWSTRRHMPHPECGCLGLPVSPAEPGTRSAPAGRAPRESAKPAAAPDDRAGSRDAPS